MLKIDSENELVSEEGLMMLPGGSDGWMRVVGRDLVDTALNRTSC